MTEHTIALSAGGRNDGRITEAVLAELIGLQQRAEDGDACVVSVTAVLALIAETHSLRDLTVAVRRANPGLGSNAGELAVTYAKHVPEPKSILRLAQEDVHAWRVRSALYEYLKCCEGAPWTQRGLRGWLVRRLRPVAERAL